MKDFKEMTALEIKEQGNKYFSMKQYELAIDCYGKAIVSMRSANMTFWRKFYTSPHTFHVFIQSAIIKSTNLPTQLFSDEEEPSRLTINDI